MKMAPVFARILKFSPLARATTLETMVHIRDTEVYYQRRPGYVTCDGLKTGKMDLLTFILPANHDSFINLKMTDLELDGDGPLNYHEPGEDD